MVINDLQILFIHLFIYASRWLFTITLDKKKYITILFPDSIKNLILLSFFTFHSYIFFWLFCQKFNFRNYLSNPNPNVYTYFLLYTILYINKLSILFYHEFHFHFNHYNDIQYLDIRYVHYEWWKFIKQYIFHLKWLH